MKEKYPVNKLKHITSKTKEKKEKKDIWELKHQQRNVFFKQKLTLSSFDCTLVIVWDRKFEQSESR